MKKPLSSMSSEEEFGPLEESSGSTPSTSQQHSKRAKTSVTSNVGSTPIATGVEEVVTSEQELIKTLIQQAAEAREARQAMTLPQTPQERAVNTFLGFLKTELLKTPEDVWFNYTMDAMTMVHNYSQQTQQQVGQSGQQQMGQPQMGVMGPPHQQAYQPQLLGGLPQMPPVMMSNSPMPMTSSLMATSPMDRSPMAMSLGYTGHQQPYSQQKYSQQQQSASTTPQQLAITSTYAVLKPVRSSSFSVLSPAFTYNTSLDTPKSVPVTPGGTTRTEAQDTNGDSSGDFGLSVTG